MARSLYSEGKDAYDRKDMAKALPAFERALMVIDLLPAGEPGMADLRTLASGFLQLSRASVDGSRAYADRVGGSGSTPAAVATGGGKTLAARPQRPGHCRQPDRLHRPRIAVTEPASCVGAPPETSSTTAAGIAAGGAAEAELSASSASRHRAGPHRLPSSEPVTLRQELPPWKPQRNEQQQFSGIVELDIDEHGDVVAARMIDAVHPMYDLQLLAAARLWKYEPARAVAWP